MAPEHSQLAQAAQRKSASAITRANGALRAMNDTGVPITFQGVAHHAGVSRQWLYKNPQLRSEIEKLRTAQAGGRRVPAAQRTSDASLRQRNATLQADNTRLRHDLADLKDELAALLGERRTTGHARHGLTVERRGD